MVMGAKLYWVIKPLMTMLVDVLIRVTELVKIEEKASGIKNFEALTLARWAKPKTIGTKKAVEAVLLMNAPKTAEATMITINMRLGSLPVWRKMSRPAIS